MLPTSLVSQEATTCKYNSREVYSLTATSNAIPETTDS